MAELGDLFIKCAKYEDIPAAYNRINTALPSDIKQKMNEIMIDCMTRFGPQGVFERFNDRSIAQILAEYEPGNAEVIASGEIEGVKYKVTRRKT